MLFGHLQASVYLLAVMGPLLISGMPVFRWFGIGILTLSVVSWKLYNNNFLSAWCFFAAVVSSMFFVYMLYENSARRKGKG